jgi:hypothetical protein
VHGEQAVPHAEQLLQNFSESPMCPSVTCRSSAHTSWVSTVRKLRMRSATTLTSAPDSSHGRVGCSVPLSSLRTTVEVSM